MPTLLGKKGYWKYGIQNEITILITPPPLIFAIFYNWLLIKNGMHTTQKLKTWIKLVRHDMPELGSGSLYICSLQPVPTKLVGVDSQNWPMSHIKTRWFRVCKLITVSLAGIIRSSAETQSGNLRPPWMNLPRTRICILSSLIGYMHITYVLNCIW